MIIDTSQYNVMKLDDDYNDSILGIDHISWATDSFGQSYRLSLPDGSIRRENRLIPENLNFPQKNNSELTFEKIEKIAKHSVKYWELVPHSIHLEKDERTYHISNSKKMIDTKLSKGCIYSAIIRSKGEANLRVLLSCERYKYLKKVYNLPESDEWGKIESQKLDHPNGYGDDADRIVQNPFDGLEL